MANLLQVPEWASEAGQSPRGVPIIDVDAQAGYEAVLEEYRQFYADPKNIPGEWKKADGDLRAEWADALAELDEPSAYWLEVAFQTMKLDVIAAFGWGPELRFHDPGKSYAQSKYPDGRGADKATSGPGGPNEARKHYKRLRGFFPG